jgi:hypothetical protein
LEKNLRLNENVKSWPLHFSDKRRLWDYLSIIVREHFSKHLKHGPYTFEAGMLRYQQLPANELFDRFTLKENVFINLLMSHLGLVLTTKIP